MLHVPDGGQLRIALWERYVSGAEFAKAGAQIVHGTKHLVPAVDAADVLTVHDVMTITRAHESSTREAARPPPPVPRSRSSRRPARRRQPRPPATG